MRTPACEHVIGFRPRSRRCSRPTLLGRWLRVFAETVAARQLSAVASANEVTMRTTSESLSPSEASHGRVAEGNCVAVRRGGEQPEAKPQTRTQVKPIRPSTMASLLANGEACGASRDHSDRHNSSQVRERIVAGGWAGYAGKLSWWTVEICTGRNLQERVRAEVRAAIVAWKRGNARGAKGGRKRNHLGKQAPSNKHDRLLTELEACGQKSLGELLPGVRIELWRQRTRQIRNWRAVCGKSACTVRRGEQGNPMPCSYIYQ
jgi:hypothetical protein